MEGMTAIITIGSVVGAVFVVVAAGYYFVNRKSKSDDGDTIRDDLLESDESQAEDEA